MMMILYCSFFFPSLAYIWTVTCVKSLESRPLRKWSKTPEKSQPGEPSGPVSKTAASLLLLIYGTWGETHIAYILHNLMQSLGISKKSSRKAGQLVPKKVWDGHRAWWWHWQCNQVDIWPAGGVFCNLDKYYLQFRPIYIFGNLNKYGLHWNHTFLKLGLVADVEQPDQDSVGNSFVTLFYSMPWCNLDKYHLKCTQINLAFWTNIFLK